MTCFTCTVLPLAWAVGPRSAFFTLTLIHFHFSNFICAQKHLECSYICIMSSIYITFHISS
ncbi:hypothetical protein Hanom_Chr09g00822151 [Helianthus anomalus]